MDGFVRGTWGIARRKVLVTLAIEPFDSLRATERDAVGQEGERLLTFVVADGGAREVRFAENPG